MAAKNWPPNVSIGKEVENSEGYIVMVILDMDGSMLPWTSRSASDSSSWETSDQKMERSRERQQKWLAHSGGGLKYKVNETEHNQLVWEQEIVKGNSGEVHAMINGLLSAPSLRQMTWEISDTKKQHNENVWKRNQFQQYDIEASNFRPDSGTDTK